MSPSLEPGPSAEHPNPDASRASQIPQPHTGQPMPVSGRVSAMPNSGSSVATAPLSPGGSAVPLMPMNLPPPLSVIRSRSGTVLSRGMILKRDYFPSGTNANNGNGNGDSVFLQGVPQFRALADPADPALHVYGSAQPSGYGIMSLLTSLGSRKPTSVKTTCISLRAEPLLFLSSRCFTLRLSSVPLHNLASYAGISPGRLEALEQRLLEDVLEESERFGGMLLVHDELPDSRVIPTWVAVSPETVATPAQLFHSLSESHEVEYHRLPLSPESAPTAGYLDDYLRILERAGPDPIVVNCGRGVGRTTWAMLALGLIRGRQKAVEAGGFRPLDRPARTGTGYEPLDRSESESPRRAAVGKRRADPRERPMEEEMGNRALLRVLYVLEKALPQVTPHETLTALLASPALLSDLKLAIMGSYTVITQLLASLPADIKTRVDALIDTNASLVNVRENILAERVRSINGEDLEKAVCALERYFWLLALAGYLEECCVLEPAKQDGHPPRAVFSPLFSQWLASQPWMSSTAAFMHARPLKPSALGFFGPLGDLTLLSGKQRPGSGNLALYAATDGIGNELESWVVRSRRGAVLASQLLLKLDSWGESTEGAGSLEEVAGGTVGATNFRRIPGLPIYASSQPALDSLEGILTCIATSESSPDKLLWINLREEPIIYLQDHPYVLRQTATALRNMRSYTGITAGNLEKIEEKLADDVRSELDEYGGRVLVHTEKDGQVVPLWVEGKEPDVRTVRDVFASLDQPALQMDYERIPMTSEQPPQEEDFDDLVEAMMRHSWEGDSTALVFNCQMGVGRSTTGTVIASLVLFWLRGGKPEQTAERRTYQGINALLRVLRNGLAAKRTVDWAVDACGAKVNLRDSVDDWRRKAEKEAGEMRAVYLKRALKHLERYFLLICFQAYLDSVSPQDFVESTRPRTFKSWMAHHAEFATLRSDLLAGDLASLVPLLPSVEAELSEAAVISSRTGSVLASQTILKPDLFPGCQKKTLKDRIDGSPNYRRISLGGMKAEALRVKSLVNVDDSWTHDSEPASIEDMGPPYVVGQAMPAANGIINVAKLSQAFPDGPRSMLWTSLREEPVVYILGAPYVLRVFNEPLKNLIITGITAERVETMEKRLKQDVLAEAEKYGGKILLHIEEATPTGYSLVPVWETVGEDDVHTPLELYQRVVAEGFKVSYARVPITDEQAPIPRVFDILLQRVLNRGWDADMVYNCQMGRGRTTTGVVVTCLCEMIVGNPALLEADRMKKAGTSSGSLENAPAEVPGARPRPLLRSPTTLEDLVERYATHGEYQLVLSLLPVLSHGKLAKRLTDRALDLCSQMQNLREAIYTFKLAGGEKRREGLNYLVRYFYLVCFADYLLDTWSRGEAQGGKQQTFVEWLGERKEIATILSNQTLE